MKIRTLLGAWTNEGNNETLRLVKSEQLKAVVVDHDDSLVADTFWVGVTLSP